MLAIAALLALAAIVVVVVVLVSSSGSSEQSQRTMESIFQDDRFLVYSTPSAAARTLNALKALGVDRVRVTLEWVQIAPQATSLTPPAHFDATNPADYPRDKWAPYDRLVELASARGIKVDFNISAPGPLWAMAHPAPAAKYAPHFKPSAAEFGQFVAAVGRRYSGTWDSGRAGHGALPRVSFWTIWNEPNQPGWLAPQWQTVDGSRVIYSARLYRAYADAAYRALGRTGHTPTSDTILIGELAPEGSKNRKDESPVPPLPFLQALYCVDAGHRPLTGTAARALNCPAQPNPGAFVKAHPGLFDVTGWAHHPYSFFLAPNVSMSDRDYVPLSDLSRLETALDQIFGTYGVQRQLPIWLTEYGYETNPPNPYRGISPARQAMYLDEAQYMAWKDPRVRSMAQFLLVDSAPDPAYPRGSVGYWSTFQTGLLYLNFRPKPSYFSYPMPIFIPNAQFKSGGSVLVWGMLRAASNSTTQHAEIQWRGAGAGYKTVTSVTTSDPNGFFTTNAKLPGSGVVRIEWTAPDGRKLYSRAAAVTQS